MGAVDVATLRARGDVREASALAVDGGIRTVALRTAEDPREDDLSTTTNENERQSRSQGKELVMINHTHVAVHIEEVLPQFVPLLNLRVHLLLLLLLLLL